MLRKSRSLGWLIYRYRSTAFNASTYDKVVYVLTSLFQYTCFYVSASKVYTRLALCCVRLWLGHIWNDRFMHIHYSEVIMSTMASQITGVSIVYSAFVRSGADQRKHQSSASLAFVRGIHRSPGNSPHKGPVTRKIFPFDDVIMLHDCFTKR